MANCAYCGREDIDYQGSIYCSKQCKDRVNVEINLGWRQRSTVTGQMPPLIVQQRLAITSGSNTGPSIHDLFRRRMPPIRLTIPIPRGIHTPLLRLTSSSPSSFERTFDLYAIAARKLFKLVLKKPIGRPIGSVDIYPLILMELQKAFAQNGLKFILYGSAALWLEQRPRPDRTPTQVIKDLDMCVYTNNPKQTEKLILKIVKGTIAGSQIDWDNVNHVFTSNQGTMEFIAADELVQFSFNMQSLEDFADVWSKSASLRLPIINLNVSIRCSGLLYITAGLIGESSMFRKTLFRSDKTRKILTYACLCVGYKVLKCEAVVGELINCFADANWIEKKAQLSNISVNRHDSTHTQYFSATEPLVQKLDLIKKFKVEQSDKTYNQKIEEELFHSLDFVDKHRSTRQMRAEVVEKRLKEEAPPNSSEKALKLLKIKISKEVAQNPDDILLDQVREIVIKDAMDIWEGEVGTGILIFLMQELAVVHGIITDCVWISEEHRDRLLKGHMQVFMSIYIKLDERLDN